MPFGLVSVADAAPLPGEYARTLARRLAVVTPHIVVWPVGTAPLPRGYVSVPGTPLLRQREQTTAGAPEGLAPHSSWAWVAFAGAERRLWVGVIDWRRLAPGERRRAAAEAAEALAKASGGEMAVLVLMAPDAEIERDELERSAGLIDAFATMQLTAEAGHGTRAGSGEWSEHVLVTPDLGIERAEVWRGERAPEGAPFPLAVWLRPE
ncbi:MAG TPA: hypothetical protein VFK80_05275 [Limnochordia bacterium]|nr:hypothetical protein [Limnochordia bacterium]